jgi:hypothetical protein
LADVNDRLKAALKAGRNSSFGNVVDIVAD